MLLDSQKTCTKRFCAAIVVSKDMAVSYFLHNLEDFPPKHSMRRDDDGKKGGACKKGREKAK